ncbi:hypothetical protein OQX61_23355 [Pedobacter sp. PLR]|uniref:DUF6630 family protein n=1 Tax=Pedobacter sp. PLR TaxID=2994465 RepID=UPI0022486B2C|nr:hypothetical protein [Pedobacter sp. PLR]MCX2454228.1 hypothetical protein [Pedobacter sp. PLR]
MNPIPVSDFLLITSRYGKVDGKSHFDSEEDLVHDIFPNRILFYTNFMDERSYEMYIQEGAICIKKTRLDDYELHEDAEDIEDDLDEDDTEELDGLWSRIVYELLTRPALKDLDIRTEMLTLYSSLFTQTERELFSKKLPKKMKADVTWIWGQVSSALEEANRLVSFEWKEWVETGVMELNDLETLQQLNIDLPYPNESEIEEVSNAEEWEEAILQYFNNHLKAFDLKLVAIGTHFDEYQTFACLSTPETNLANARENFKKLGMVYKG